MTPEQFKELIMPNERRMRLQALRLTANSDDAADAVQDALEQLWKRRERLGSVNSLEAYCITTVNHCCVDILRRRKGADCLSEQSAGATNPSENYDYTNQLMAVKQIIASLPASQARIVSLHDLEQQSIEEIVSQTGLSAGNVRVLLSRARQKIRRYFQ